MTTQHFVKNLTGVPGVTQCAIGPGDTFSYEFSLDAPGTLWWHSHSGLQKSSLYGALIVQGDKRHLPTYDYERVLLLNDWFHDSTTTQVAGLLNPSFRWVGDPDALLINGQGEFNCSTLGPMTSADVCDQSEAKPFVLHVKPSTTYRLRLIGASSLAFLNFGIDGHVMSVVEAETTLTRPMPVKFLDIGGGQSYSVLLRTKSVEQLAKLKNNNGMSGWFYVLCSVFLF